MAEHPDKFNHGSSQYEDMATPRRQHPAPVDLINAKHKVGEVIDVGQEQGTDDTSNGQAVQDLS